MLQDVGRNGNEDIGKPEPLKHSFRGYWSKPITDEHRLVYEIVDDEIESQPVATTATQTSAPRWPIAAVRTDGLWWRRGESNP